MAGERQGAGLRVAGAKGLQIGGERPGRFRDAFALAIVERIGIGGQVVIAVGENRLVIGTGMARKIWVKSMGGSGPERDSLAARPLQSSDAVSLSQMKAGQEGTIIRVSGESLLRRRLLEMGINRGTRVYVEKYAPLKDPLELVVKGYHISLRVEEAANILVENIRSEKR